ncbi:MAG: hypothetical protein M1518_00350 [Candidatus Thermoplasmatota archaeon]|jgi:hypothetical protein|nr:hypothetical protein [Candidatus Thermoplasmatota archaeon]
MVAKLHNKTITNVIVIAAVVAIISLGIGTGLFAGYFMANSSLTSSQGKITSANSGPFQLILVVTTNNFYNTSTGYQPAFFVLQNGTLKSSANITIPANEQIDVTIINYDDGNGSVGAVYANVTGTLNGKEAIFNNTNVNSSENANGILLNGSEQVSSVPVNNIAHTFTVQNGSNVVLNLPITPSSVVQTSFILHPGTYTWQCEVSCGSGPTGWEGAMSTPGWMAGTLYVH